MKIEIKCRGAEQFHIDDLLDFQGDLKTLSEENYQKFKSELIELGFSEPISVWISPQGKKYILNGHQRKATLLRMRTEGYEIPLIPVNLVEADDIRQAKRKVLALTSQFGIMSQDGLKNFCEQNSFNVSDILKDFRFPELSQFDSIPEKLGADEDEFDSNEEGVKSDIKLGDLFEIGEHRLICGDSTKRETFDKLFDGEKCDMVITDPPYNVDYSAKSNDLADYRPNKNIHTDIENDKMDDKTFYTFLLDFYKALGEFTKDGGSWYVWHADSEGANFRKAMEESGLMFKQCLVWVKNHIVLGRQDYQWKHEPCLYGWKPGAAHNWYSDRKQTTLLNFDKPQSSAEHPTMKPIKLFAYQIENSSKIGDIIADGFLGSGTSMVAAHQW